MARCTEMGTGGISSLWGRAPLMEELEPRLLLSVAPMATPNFLVHNPIRVGSAAVSGPVGLTPLQIRHAYGFDQTTFGSIKGDGTGQTIAIVDAYNDPNIVSDLHIFDTTFGLSDPTLIQISQTGTSALPGTDPAGKGNSWAEEISLDVEWAHVAAPNATILLVEAKSASTSDLFTAINTAAHYSGVSVVSMSWGMSEFSTESTYDHYFITPSGHTGVTFVAASGDNGAYATGSSRTLSAEYPAASPNVLSVGGTTLTLDSSGNYVSESGWGNGVRSGLYGGSGGGISRYINQPSWQKGVVTQSTTKRTVPDVAFNADPNTGVAVYDSWDSSTSPWAQIGGTSLAAPMWAGLIAVVNQGRALASLPPLDGSTQTLSKIYALPSKDFNDVTTGNNGYAAGLGYDLVTGRGTPIVNKLVPDLAGLASTPVPVIGTLTVNPASIQTGTTVTLTAGSVMETSGTISDVTFYAETNSTAGLQIGSDTLLGVGTQNGTSWSVALSTTGLAPGNYTYYAVATDTAAVTSDVASTVLTVLAPAPTNDNFSAATVLAGQSASATGSNVGATKQAGEPATIAGNVGGASVWYNWTAPVSGRVTASTAGSSFDTILGVYTGASVSGLTLVGSNDDASSSTLTSALAFSAVQGVTYRIAVDGYNGATGNISLGLSEAVAPVNDNFSNATRLSGRPATWTGTNVGATIQAGEPIVAGNAGGSSIWFSWTAPVSTTIRLNTHGSSFDTILGVYKGSSVSALTLVKSNDDDPAGGTLTSALTFSAVSGTTYYFVVDGYNGAQGNVTLNLS
jgi:subtilase family serine protease